MYYVCVFIAYLVWDKNIRGKSKYESPVLVPLGEMAKGSGACVAGVSDVVDCTAGTAALNNCTDAGVAALVACSAGNSAEVACSGGAEDVVGGCTGGGLPT